jgi:hypothetical protein
VYKCMCVCVCTYVCFCVCACVYIYTHKHTHTHIGFHVYGLGFVERGNAADKLNGRNTNVSFTNNSNVPIEAMIFIFYSDEIAVDVKTGLVTRHKN